MSLIPRAARGIVNRSVGQYIPYKFMELLNSEYGNFIKKQNQRVRDKYGPKKKKASAMSVAAAEGNGQYKTLRKKKQPARKAKVPLTKRVNKLEKKTKESYAVHVYKTSATVQPSSSQNQCGYTELQIVNKTAIETALAAIPIVNTGAPGTATQMDATLLDNPTKWHVEIFGQAFIRNNYLFPCELRVYICKPKVQTGNTASTQVTTGLAKLANPTLTTDTLFFYPNDVPLFKQTYSVIKSQKLILQTGDEIKIPFSEKMVYDQEYGDNVTSTYDPRYARMIMIRVSGCLAHDSATTTNIGYTATKLDAVIYRKYTFRRPALAPIQTMYGTSGLNAMTTSVVGADSAETENAL